jgi:hypothetical protein
VCEEGGKETAGPWTHTLFEASPGVSIGLLVDMAKAIVGFARLFRPRYALANLGHPSSSLGSGLRRTLPGFSVALGRHQGSQGVLDRGGPSGGNGVTAEAMEFCKDTIRFGQGLDPSRIGL